MHGASMQPGSSRCHWPRSGSAPAAMAAGANASAVDRDHRHDGQAHAAHHLPPARRWQAPVQYGAVGVHLGPSPFAGQSGAFTALAKPGLARSGPNVAALNYDAQTDFSSSWIRFDKPQSKVSFYACRDGGARRPAAPERERRRLRRGRHADRQPAGHPVRPERAARTGHGRRSRASRSSTWRGRAARRRRGPAGRSTTWSTRPTRRRTCPRRSWHRRRAADARSRSPASRPPRPWSPAARRCSARRSSDQAQRLDWDVTGDGRTDVSCPGTQTTLGFRAAAGWRPARAASAFTGAVTVRAFDAAGASTSFAQKLAVAPAPASTVSSALEARPGGLREGPGGVHVRTRPRTSRPPRSSSCSRKDNRAFCELLKGPGVRGPDDRLGHAHA